MQKIMYQLRFSESAAPDDGMIYAEILRECRAEQIERREMCRPVALPPAGIGKRLRIDAKHQLMRCFSYAESKISIM